MQIACHASCAMHAAPLAACLQPAATAAAAAAITVPASIFSHLAGSPLDFLELQYYARSRYTSWKHLARNNASGGLFLCRKQKAAADSEVPQAELARRQRQRELRELALKLRAEGKVGRQG